MLTKTLSKRVSADFESCMFKFSPESSHLKSIFKSSVTKALSTRNKSMKEALFVTLGYKYLLMTRRKDTEDRVKALPDAEIKEVYYKMFKEDS